MLTEKNIINLHTKYILNALYVEHIGIKKLCYN